MGIRDFILLEEWQIWYLEKNINKFHVVHGA